MRTSLIFLSMALSLPAATVTIQPSAAVIAPGADTQISILVSDITDLYAFGFDLVFQPELNALDVNEGAFLPEAGATFFIAGTIDNTGDTVSGIGDSVSGFGPGVTGSGTLLTIDMTGVAPGVASLSLANPIFLDSGFNDIPFTEVDSSVTVTTPEPRSWALVLAGFLVAGIARRRIES